MGACCAPWYLRSYRNFYRAHGFSLEVGICDQKTAAGASHGGFLGAAPLYRLTPWPDTPLTVQRSYFYDYVCITQPYRSNAMSTWPHRHRLDLVHLRLSEPCYCSRRLKKKHCRNACLATFRAFLSSSLLQVSLRDCILESISLQVTFRGSTHRHVGPGL